MRNVDGSCSRDVTAVERNLFVYTIKNKNMEDDCLL